MENMDQTIRALSLPGLLNILYRGRRLVLAATLAGLVAGVAYGIITRPLYLATAQVRPGIVSYSDMGAPLREWALKDIVRWFRTDLYWPDMRHLPGYVERKGPPIIVAEYIPVGPQYQQGGDVITLTNLDRDPLAAVGTLRHAIDSFNQQASMDSLGSTMHLTIGGARVRMAKIRNDIEHVTAAEERTRMDIAARHRALELVGADSRRLDLQIARLESGRTWREDAAVAIGAEAEASRERLVRAQDLLERVMAADSSAGGGGRTGDPETDVLLQVARREQAGRVGELLATVDDLSARMTTATVTVDTLRDAITAIDLKIARLKLERDVDLAKRRGDIEQEIADLELKLSRDLPFERAQLEADWQGEKVLVDLLTPLEQIGRISVTDKPVRPRKLRAAAILTGLGLVSGMFLVLALEYFRRNRDQILAAGD